jgi:hypothetical protein
MAKGKKKAADDGSPRGGKSKGKSKGKDNEAGGRAPAMDKSPYADHLEQLELELNDMARWL